MAEIMGNVMILVFKDGTLNVTSAFNALSVLKILGIAATTVADGELKKQKPEPEKKTMFFHPELADKYKTQ